MEGVEGDLYEKWLSETKADNKRNLIPKEQAELNSWQKFMLSLRKKIGGKTKIDSLLALLDSDNGPLNYITHLFISNSQDFAYNLDHIGKLKHDLPKTTSRVDFLYDVTNPENPLNGIVVNQIPTESAEVWRRMHEEGEIPVAPILKRKDGSLRMTELSGSNNITRCVSRFCGLSLGLLVSKNENMMVKGELLTEIRKQANDIREQLGKSVYRHGHPHLWNLTLEFIDRDYFASQIEAGETINSIPYKVEMWEFNPNKAAEDLKKWKPVVRVIDFDHAVMKERGE